MPDMSEKLIIPPEVAVMEAIKVAAAGMRGGEMPIGAVLYSGNEKISSSFTKEMELGRKVVHADLLAMIKADKIIKFDKTYRPLVLAVNLEPCIMCIGAAITLGVSYIYYGLESPNDGAHKLIKKWHPPITQEYFKLPKVISGGYHRNKVIEQFREYAKSDGPMGMRKWARSLTA